MGRSGEGEGLGCRRTSEVLAGVESANGSDISQISQLQEVVLLAEGADSLVVVREIASNVVSLVVLVLIVVSVALALVVPVVSTMSSVHFDSFRHRRKSDTFWQVGQRIDKSSLFGVSVVEAAAITELASARFLPVLAGDGLVVRVHSSQSGLAEVLRKRLKNEEFVTYISSLSKFFSAMSELAVLFERTASSVQEMFAELGLVLLFQRVELALVSIEVVIVTLLSQVPEDLARRVVEVAFLAIFVLRLGRTTLLRVFARRIGGCGRSTVLVRTVSLVRRLLWLWSRRILRLFLFGLGVLACVLVRNIGGDVLCSVLILGLLALGGFFNLRIGRHTLNIA